MKLNSKQHALLLEALRRYHSFHAGRDPLKAWTGLGTMPMYRPVLEAGLMEPACPNPAPKRYNNWYRLTPKGLAAILQLANEGHRVEGYQVYLFKKPGELPCQ